MVDKPGKQLRIGAPNRESHQRTFLESFALTSLICAVALWVLVPTVFLGAPEQAPLTAKEQETVERDLLTRLAAPMQSLSLDEAREQVPTWSHKQLQAALRHGPRHVSEVTCERVLDQPEDASKAHPATQREALYGELAATLRDRAEHAPRICLVAYFLYDRLPKDTPPQLLRAISDYWAALRSFETIEAQDAFLVNGLRLSERLPRHSSEFMLWLRQCATSPERASWRSCVRAMRDLAPAQGSDLLEMVELDLLDREQPASPPDEAHMLRLISTLRELSLHGSPQEWRIESHPHLLRYDYDLRLASLFALCRWTHSPQKEVALSAASAVRDNGQFEGLGTDDNLFRTRDTCRILFGGNYHDVEIASVPLLVENRVPALTVVQDTLDETPGYSFAALIERGDCALDDDRPLWYCGAKLWKGRFTDITEAVKEAYVNTRYVSWAPRDEIPPLDYMLLRKDVLLPPQEEEATPSQPDAP